MNWYIRRVDRLINPYFPRPYLSGFGAGSFSAQEAFWTEHARDAASYGSEQLAEVVASGYWGSDWRDLVRIVPAEDT